MTDKNLKKNLNLLLEKCQGKDSLSLGEILEIFSGKGRMLVLILLSLPFCQPLQIPGLSTPFGLVIAYIGLKMAVRSQKVLLPKSVLAKKVSSQTLQKISNTGLKLLEKIEHFIRPRLQGLSTSRAMEILNGLLIVILGIFLALPLPIPLTNLVAGWSILLLSIGLLEYDGVFILAGYLVSLLTVIFFISLIFTVKYMAISK